MSSKSSRSTNDILTSTMAPTKSYSARVLCPVKEESELHHSHTCSDCKTEATSIGSLVSTLSKSSITTKSGSDSGVFTVPEGVEEGFAEKNSSTKEYRQRSGSAGLKSLFSFKRSRNKSGDTSKEGLNRSSSPTNVETNPDKAKGLKSIFRQRSQSDAAAAKSAMLRRRHISQGGSPIGPAIVDTNGVGLNNNYEVSRGRSTSWGAKERLAMCKQMKVTGTGAGNNNITPMSQLISNGGVPINRKVEKLSPGGTGDSHFTGKAFIWQRASSVDEGSSRRQWNTADVMETEFEDLVRGDPEIFTKFMKAHKSYDLIPTSCKLIVFDTQLSVKKAFYALVYNGVRAAPLWDNATQDFVGMLTISDFILMLTRYYTSPEHEMCELEEHKITTWREVLSDHYRPLISLTPDASLYEAVRTLILTKVHRLPIIDPATGNALYILTHKRVLKFLYIFMKNLPQPEYMDCRIDELKIGTFTNIASVTRHTRLIDALNIFVQRRISALPVVNENNQVENIFAKFDVINLAADKAYSNLDIPVSQALGYRKASHEIPVQSCHCGDSLKIVVEKFVRAEVHRLVIVDHSNRLDGIISLSDVLSFLVREDRLLSESFGSVSCSEGDCNSVFEDDVSLSFSDMALSNSTVTSIPSSSTTAVEDKMEIFPSEPLEAI